MTHYSSLLLATVVTAYAGYIMNDLYEGRSVGVNGLRLLRALL